MVYTIAEREFLKSYIPGHFSYEIQSAFEERFGRCLTYAQIKNFKGNNKIWSGVNTTFKKKHVPANKGKKMSTEQYAKCKGTMFKRGHKAQENREQHNDKIPPDKIVIFKDNNPLNCDIDNLMLVSKSENLRVNAMGGGCYTGQAKETAVAIARLDILISKRRKKRKDGG